MRRLSAATLDQLPSSVRRPGYDRALVQSGVVHLGIGAFHRAHQASVFEAALEAGDARWGITAASLRSPAVRDAMAPQDGLYALVEREGRDEHRRVIGAVKDVLVAPEDPAALVAALARPETHLVTITVTEKGYGLDPVSGEPTRDREDMAADLTALDRPRTPIGFIVAGLAARRRAGLKPFTTLSCDNLPGNGRRLARGVAALARAHDERLGDWIEAYAAFPQTMVDRIVPATTREDIAALAAAIGVEDCATVATEPFWQWVVEDRFCSERPALKELGVQLTEAVEPWEDAKLRLLNGAHSALAYLGLLAGHRFVHEAVADPVLRRFVGLLWDEAASTLSPPPGLDVAGYRAALMKRFDNVALHHRLDQIATDGSQKLPQRLVAPLMIRRARGQLSPALSLAIAGWAQWLERGRGGKPSPDPLIEVIAPRLAAAGDAAASIGALLTIGGIFPPALADDHAARDLLSRQLASIRRDGPYAAAASAFAARANL